MGTHKQMDGMNGMDVWVNASIFTGIQSKEPKSILHIIDVLRWLTQKPGESAYKVANSLPCSVLPVWKCACNNRKY